MEFCSQTRTMEELLERAKIRIESCPKPVLKEITFNGYPNKVGWSDQKLQDIAKDIKFAPEIFESTSYKSIINQFFNFYFAANIKKPAIIQSTIYCAAAIFNVRMENGGYRKMFDEEYMDQANAKVTVNRWLMAQRAGSEEEEIKFIIHEALLESIECHGMGIIKLLLSVMKYTGRTFEDLMSVICVVATDCLVYPDWQLMVNFYREYLADKNPPHSLPWVRLIDNDYFRNCSSKDSPYVAATLTAIIEKREGPGVWKAEWIRRIRASPYFLLVGQKLGYIVREILMPTEPEKESQNAGKKVKVQKRKTKNVAQPTADVEIENQNVEHTTQDIENGDATQKTDDLEIRYQELVKKTRGLEEKQDSEVGYLELLKKTEIEIENQISSTSLSETSL